MDFISVATLLSFILTCALIESTPGPNMAYIAVLSATEGRRAGYAAVFGIALGLLIIGLAAALGLATLISNSILAYQTLRFSGVAYLLWLAWDTWKFKPLLSSSEVKSLIYNAKFFKRGLITNLLNPKAAIFYIAMLPKFMSPDYSSVSQAVILTIIFVMVATIIHALIVTLAGTAREFLENDNRRLIIRRVLSLVLVGIAIWFAISTGQKI
ncbi:MAG: LysE family translocator [Alphaproteobacteria bacterium]|nr:LysE family translocator [Alphaproteobacteria bacterium]NCQ88899.1 LysE family translocator [Alphaproteobacteria bacterium]NCT07802.1 LysE family translocator [Alphaproteobacteria bacterium]